MLGTSVYLKLRLSSARLKSWLKTKSLFLFTQNRSVSVQKECPGSWHGSRFQLQLRGALVDSALLLAPLGVWHGAGGDHVARALAPGDRGFFRGVLNFFPFGTDLWQVLADLAPPLAPPGLLLPKPPRPL